MILIIAEKPSLGRNIAAAIGSTMGGMNKRTGYFENEKYSHDKPVREIERHAFSPCYTITSVVIPDSIVETCTEFDADLNNIQ